MMKHAGAKSDHSKRRYAIYGMGALLLLALFGCAKENSDSEVKSTQQKRAYEHNQPAVGQFNGTIPVGHNKVVPVSFEIVNNYLANESSAQLRVTMQIGLFGGVTFYTEAVSYNWSTGLLSASFGRGASAPGAAAPNTGGHNQNIPLELTATLHHNQITDAVLKPAHSETVPITFSSNTRDQLFGTSQSGYEYGLHFGNSKIPAALLSLSPKQESESAPENIDLPQVPALLGDIRFNGIARVANSFQRIIYNPLTGQMDLVITPTSRIHFTEIGIPAQAALYGPATMTGDVLEGGTQISKITAVQINDDALSRFNQVPPLYFTGKITNPEGDSSPASASIDYEGQDILNPGMFPFPNIPQLGLKIYLCQDSLHTEDKISGEITLTLVSIDQMKQVALFRDQNLARRVELLMNYSPGFDTMEGRLRTPKSARNGDAGSHVYFVSSSESTWQACQ